MPPYCREVCSARALILRAQPSRNWETPKDRFFACFPRRSTWTAPPTKPHEIGSSTTSSLHLTEGELEDLNGRHLDGGTEVELSKRKVEPGNGTKIESTAAISKASLVAPRDAREVHHEWAEDGGRITEFTRHGGTRQNVLPQRSITRVPGESAVRMARLGSLVERVDSIVEKVRGSQAVRPKTVLRNRLRLHRESYLTKGTLAFDWRVPLEKLKRHTPSQRQRSKQRALTQEEREDRSLLRQVKANATHHVARRVDQIPVPTLWNKSTVAQYIYDIGALEVSNGKHRAIYGNGAVHRDAVKTRLIELFDDPNVRGGLSRTAFHLAMSCLNKHSWVRQSRQLFSRMSDFNISPTKDTFHIMFGDIAVKRDLHAFTLLLKTMLSLGIKPGAKTWKWFFICVESTLVKYLILDRMKSLNLLKGTKIVRALATNLLTKELRVHISSGRSMYALMERYDRRFGKDWFSVPAGNAIVHELGLSGKTDEAIQMLEIMVRRGVQPDVVTLQVLLKGCRAVCKTDDVYGAVEVLRLFRKEFRMHPDAPCFQVLFSMGLELQRANFCRAVWRGACLQSAATNEMSIKVMKALTFVPTEGSVRKLPRSAFFYAFPAKVIAGIETTAGAIEAWRSLRQQQQQQQQVKAVDGGQRLRDSAAAIRDGDREASKHLRYAGTHSFADLLEQAADKDREWLDKEEYKAGDVDWMLSNAVPVHVIARTSEK